ncbi:MAG TPA: urate hydroxylase PuuD [Xanthobacteraceae bacterium]|nr:urate hydroxylase PuuD [Xanthobacteraceae bacterium]
MDVFVADWLNLILRWAHLVVGIGWIGTSFYFIALDLGLRKNPASPAGVYGEQWQVHGGGFYHVEKFTVAPPQLPKHLVWFRWEAYLTWMTGFGLLVVQYYWNARAYLIDPAVFDIAPMTAIAISIGTLAAGWFIYDLICRSPIGQHTVLLSTIVFILIVAESWGLSHVFSGRGAFIHIGSLIGTIMAVNVFFVIIPNQRKLVAQLTAGQEPDPRYGAIGKQRSVHNNYLTLPVLLMMVSNHYPMLYSHPYSWLVVALILMTGGLVRHLINRHDAGDEFHAYSWAAPIAAIALASAITVTAPQTATSSVQVADAEVLQIVNHHCTVCHARRPKHPGFAEAPKDMRFETLRDLRQYARLVQAQAVQSTAMPLGNETRMTREERDKLGAWLAGGGR